MQYPKQNEIQEWFYQKEGVLYWKKAKAPVKKDTPSGYLDQYGYLQTRFNFKLYRTHRIVWILLKGDIPAGMEVDHVDGNRTNNKITNLRLVTRGANNKNKKQYKRNTSGVTGITWDKLKNKWVAQISVDKKVIHLGRYNDIQDAIKARHQAEIQYGYHPNHGRRQ